MEYCGFYLRFLIRKGLLTYRYSLFLYLLSLFIAFQSRSLSRALRYSMTSLSFKFVSTSSFFGSGAAQQHRLRDMSTIKIEYGQDNNVYNLAMTPLYVKSISGGLSLKLGSHRTRRHIQCLLHFFASRRM